MEGSTSSASSAIRSGNSPGHRLLHIPPPLCEAIVFVHVFPSFLTASCFSSHRHPCPPTAPLLHSRIPFLRLTSLPHSRSAISTPFNKFPPAVSYPGPPQRKTPRF